MKNKSFLRSEILKILPNTQCKQCGQATCADFAEVLIKRNGSINDCPPGGEEVRIKLAQILDRQLDPSHKLHKKSIPMVAHVDENNCIGCAKCLDACPMDSIIGTKTRIHTIVTDWCTGCELCGLVCPTDCITFLVRSSEKRKLFKEEAAQRFFNKQIRVEKLRKIEEKSSVFINVDDRSKKELLKTLVDTI